jgi:hypothetical protein
MVVGISTMEHNGGGMVSWGLEPTTYQNSRNLIK